MRATFCCSEMRTNGVSTCSRRVSQNVHGASSRRIIGVHSRHDIFSFLTGQMIRFLSRGSNVGKTPSLVRLRRQEENIGHELDPDSAYAGHLSNDLTDLHKSESHHLKLSVPISPLLVLLAISQSYGPIYLRSSILVGLLCPIVARYLFYKRHMDF